MNKFIAYFDYLGFKQFIENNDLAYQKTIVARNFLDMEMALSLGKKKVAPRWGISDIKNSNINCINFSDTVVFWTNDDSETSLMEIINVSYRFNWQNIKFIFPARGSLVYGEIESVMFEQHNEGGGHYNINSVYGKGLVKAYEKAEKQHWAGTVLHETFINELTKRDYDIDIFLSPYAKKFKVPYKDGIDLPEEYVMNIVKGNDFSAKALKNCCDAVRENFGQHNKSVDNPDVREKIRNTINFIESFYKPNILE